ncbi:MAG TPA: adenylate/guanylate cyclase domain-containing protein, partial [Leptospiraceae bacterium]|nr:adenylate/guanylate cyclase domain-containing protein [Leptospiraceae bacterium]
KYIGDSIMALFPESAEHALNASISMLRELRIYNEERIRKNLSPIKIGIGLNTGNLMLGTIGGKNRMDGTVISDSVNLASRLESLTKTLYIPILISETVYNHLQNKEQFSIREIDTVFVRGKSKPIVIYECFDADEEQVRICKKKNLENFSKGLIAFRENQFQKAKEYFIECEKKCPEDSIAFIYINRCNEKLA